MSHVKQASKRKTRTKAATVLGVAGALSLAGASGAAVNPPGDTLTANTALTLDEEEISDVSLSTFYFFDNENTGAHRPSTCPEDTQSTEARLRGLRRRLRRRRPHMLRKLRKRRRAGWFVVVSYLPRSQ